MKKCSLVVLAAGMGSRYGGLKQIDEISPNGETLLDYSLFKAINYFDKIIFIIRKSFEDDFKKRISKKFKTKIKVEHGFQEFETNNTSIKRTKPWGTAQALLEVEHLITEPFAVINADDFYGEDAFKVISNYLRTNCDATHQTMVGYSLKNTLSKNGSVSRGICKVDEKNNLINITETHKIIEKGDKIVSLEDKNILLNDNTIASMNLFGLHQSILEKLKKGFDRFLSSYQNDNSEYLLPTIISEMLENKEISVKVLKCKDKWFGITYKEDKVLVQDEIKSLIQNKIYPKKLW